MSADAPDTAAIETAEGEVAPLAYAEVDDCPRDGGPRRGGWLRWAMAATLLCTSLTAVLMLAGLLLHRTTRTQPSAAPTATVPAIMAPAQPVAPVSAHVAAERVKVALPSEVALLALTGDNDANHLLGRPNGYAAATVIVDPRSDEWCDRKQPGVDCGATIEQWLDAAAAQRRADYIQTILAQAPILGTEYDTVRGNLLLRVSGKFAPAVADQYKAAFMAA